MAVTSLDRRAIKDVIKKIRGQECMTIDLDRINDRFAAHSIRQMLESMGAMIAIEESDKSTDVTVAKPERLKR